MGEKKSTFQITGFTLKIIAVVTMLIDHIGAVIIERMLNGTGFGNFSTLNERKAWFANPTNNLLFNLDEAFRTIGRIAFPLFAFLLVEGFFYTKSRLKHLIRLLIFCIISEVPFDLAISSRYFDLSHQNVIFTMTLGFLAIWGMDAIKNRTSKKKGDVLLTWLSAILFGACAFNFLSVSMLGAIMESYPGWKTPYALGSIYFVGPGFIQLILYGAFSFIFLVIFIISSRKKKKSVVIKEALSWYPVYGAVLLANLCHVDYKSAGVLAIVIFYRMRANQVKAMAASSLLLIVYNFSEYSSILNLLPVKFYNGKQGRKMKYFFYIFYPAHLLILYLITLL